MHETIVDVANDSLKNPTERPENVDTDGDTHDNANPSQDATQSHRPRSSRTLREAAASRTGNRDQGLSNP
jgi:hypothetical protein